MSNKKRIINSIAFTLISIGFTLLVKFVDVAAIGPQNSSVGFSHINGWFHNIFKGNMTIYKISELFGYILLLLVVIYGCIGLCQLIKRKSLLKVDKEIIKLGVFYVLMLVVYVLFEKVEINFRPILIEGTLEASYPSSHTILSLCVGLSSLIVSQKYFNKKYIKLINGITIGLMVVVLLTRIISGVHWISDIVGGIITSLTLLSYFRLMYDWNNGEK